MSNNQMRGHYYVRDHNVQRCELCGRKRSDHLFQEALEQGCQRIADAAVEFGGTSDDFGDAVEAAYVKARLEV